MLSPSESAHRVFPRGLSPHRAHLGCAFLGPAVSTAQAFLFQVRRLGPRPDSLLPPTHHAPEVPLGDPSTGDPGLALQGLLGGAHGPPSGILGTIMGEAQEGGIREGFLEEEWTQLVRKPGEQPGLQIRETWKPRPGAASQSLEHCEEPGWTQLTGRQPSGQRWPCRLPSRLLHTHGPAQPLGESRDPAGVLSEPPSLLL